MRRKNVWQIFALVLFFGVLMIGCRTITVADPVETKRIHPLARDFYILGIVEFQQNQRRDITYADVLNHARAAFPTANAVLDLRIENVVRQVGPITRRIGG